METVKIKITRTGPHDDVPLPAYQSVHAAGMDVHAAVEEDMVIPPNTTGLVPTGFAIAVPVGYEAQLRPRSGLALKKGITLLNTPGTIDADYRGEVKIIMTNLGAEDFVIKRGDRIAQMVINKVEQGEWVEVKELDETDRSSGGFGHTGV